MPCHIFKCIYPSSSPDQFCLLRCLGITDTGILAISSGCTGLQMINIAYCTDVTDISLVSLSKCSKLNTFESRGCVRLTSLGLGAIAVACKQLTKLDIKKCCNINDAGMVPLAQYSHNLRQVRSLFLFYLCCVWFNS